MRKLELLEFSGKGASHVDLFAHTHARVRLLNGLVACRLSMRACQLALELKVNSLAATR